MNLTREKISLPSKQNVCQVFKSIKVGGSNSLSSLCLSLLPPPFRKKQRNVHWYFYKDMSLRMSLFPAGNEVYGKSIESSFLAGNELTPSSFPAWLKIRPLDMLEWRFDFKHEPNFHYCYSCLWNWKLHRKWHENNHLASFYQDLLSIHGMQ